MSRSHKQPTIPCTNGCGTLMWARRGASKATEPMICFPCRNLLSMKLETPLEYGICNGCGGPFIARIKRQYCEPCRKLYHIGHGGTYDPNKFNSTTKICPECGQEFEWVPPIGGSGGPPRKYCGSACANRVAHRTRRHKERANGKRGASKNLRNQRINVQTPRGSTFTNREMAERDHWICHLCGGVIDPNAPINSLWSLNRDHIIPIVYGGADIMENSKAAHHLCNAQRGAISLEEWFSVTLAS